MLSYLSLARKYRPRLFADLVGQEALTLALGNALRLRREPHSVILTGVRGVGKTTTARIYAKALNCERGPSPEPCAVCYSCQAVQNGTHEDVLEIDGASNTGVDDVRALQETLVYVPQRSAFKVYIIDEVHMLSISAFNALLKTLEEPPEHVVFIFATTELHKVPETIQSRCQTFHLQKISRQLIQTRLAAILKTEGIAYEDEALALVAREGRGSLRDALTLLDQAIALGGGTVTVSGLRHVLGHSQVLPAIELLEALLNRDARESLRLIAQWDQEGLALASLVEELAKACRNAFILRDLKAQALDLQILEMEEKERQQLQLIAEKAVAFDLNRLFRSWIKCLDDLRHVELDRFVVENYALEWCLDPGLPDFQNYVQQLAKGGAEHKPIPSPVTPQAQAQASKSNVTPPLQPPVLGPAPAAPTQAAKEGGLGLRDRWKQNQQVSPVLASSATSAATAPAPVAPSKSEVTRSTDLAQPSPEAPSQTVEIAPPSDKTLLRELPNTWRECVEAWKKEKPLQARVLEETYVLEYGPQRIRLAVDPQSMAGGKLLQVDMRKRFHAQFEQLFGFTGQLDVVAKEGAGGTAISGQSPPEEAPALGETLLAVKQRERELAREEMRQRLTEHPITREVISAFGGTIETIDLP